MNQRNEQYAVITGAGSGLGKAYAYELAKRSFNLILVSLPNEGLCGICKNIEREYSVRTTYFEVDLTEQLNVINLAAKINENFKVSVLINNAGTGGSRSFLQASRDYINRIIQLNVLATTLLTHELTPNLIKQEHSFILNVSSMAAFVPTGYKTVYPASKLFIYSFSRGLNEELSKMGVSVCVVHPGPMKTNIEITNRINKQGLLARLLLNDPGRVARDSVEMMLKGKPIVIPSKWIAFLLSIIPNSIATPLLTRLVERELSL